MKRQKLIQLRTKKGLTRAELAKILNVAEVTIRKIESGSRNPSINMAKKFAVYYQKDLEELFPDIFLITKDTKRNILNA